MPTNKESPIPTIIFVPGNPKFVRRHCYIHSLQYAAHQDPNHLSRRHFLGLPRSGRRERTFCPCRDWDQQSCIRLGRKEDGGECRQEGREKGRQGGPMAMRMGSVRDECC